MAILAAAAACARPQTDAARAGRLAALKARQESLWKAFDQDKAASDAIVAEALGDESEVQVALRGTLLKDLLTDVAARYLDRVALDLPLDARVDAEGEVKVKGALGLGTLTAGTWRVQLVIQRVTGVLSAHKPKLDLARAPKIALELPVALERAKGTATVAFHWDSRGIANVVCKDFDVSRKVEGILLPDVQTFSGALALEASQHRILARPGFRDVPYRLKADLTPESWKDVEAALVEQDSLFKCGIAMDPQVILPKLRELLLRGFEVHLPKKLFRSFELPASLEQKVAAEDKAIVVSVKAGGLRYRQDALWFGAAVSARVETR